MQSIDLKRFRRDKNLTQLDIAELFKCKQNFISNIETGIKPIPADKLDVLQSKYGDISEYITNENKAIGAPANAAINQDIISMPADVWEVIRNQAESLKTKDAQTSEVIGMLKEQMKKNYRVGVKSSVANRITVEDE